MINTHSTTLLISLWSLLTLTYLLTRNHLPRPRSTVRTCDLRLIIVLLEVPQEIRTRRGIRLFHQLTITHQVSLKRRLPLCPYRMPNFMLSYVLSSLLQIYMKNIVEKRCVSDVGALPSIQLLQSGKSQKLQNTNNQYIEVQQNQIFAQLKPIDPSEHQSLQPSSPSVISNISSVNQAFNQNQVLQQGNFQPRDYINNNKHNNNVTGGNVLPVITELMPPKIENRSFSPIASFSSVQSSVHNNDHNSRFGVHYLMSTSPTGFSLPNEPSSMTTPVETASDQKLEVDTKLSEVSPNSSSDGASSVGSGKDSVGGGGPVRYHAIDRIETSINLVLNNNNNNSKKSEKKGE